MSGSEYESSNEEDEMYIAAAGGVGGFMYEPEYTAEELTALEVSSTEKELHHERLGNTDCALVFAGVFVHTALNNPIQHHAFVVMKPQQSKEFWNVWLRSMELRFNALLIILDLNQYALMFLFLEPLTKDLGQNQCSSK
uniref:uncharacterized protein LOC120330332 isoform X2 n=1 Tax=Styela clava TaxID=7725 RepID=UPI0019398A60|nr:uncharacterized protein LOC120330332 isoform X2 [Styela clava]